MSRGSTPTEEAVYAAVERAWKETLPSVAFGPEIEWAEGGADSLSGPQDLDRSCHAEHNASAACSVAPGKISPK